MKPWTRRENIVTAWLPAAIAFFAGGLSHGATGWQTPALGFALAATVALTFLHLEARRKNTENRP